MEVQYIMTKNPVSLEADHTVQEAMDLMFGHDIRHIPVVKEKALIGIVSDRDLKSYYLTRAEMIVSPEASREVLDNQVGEIIQDDIISVFPTTEVVEVINIMIDHKVGAIPVIEEKTNHLVGIVSYIDVLRTAAEFIG